MQDVVKIFSKSGTPEDRQSAMMSEVKNMVRAKVQVESSKSGASSPNLVFWTTRLLYEPHLGPCPAIGMVFRGRCVDVCMYVVQSERVLIGSTECAAFFLHHLVWVVEEGSSPRYKAFVLLRNDERRRLTNSTQLALVRAAVPVN